MILCTGLVFNELASYEAGIDLRLRVLTENVFCILNCFHDHTMWCGDFLDCFAFTLEEKTT